MTERKIKKEHILKTIEQIQELLNKIKNNTQQDELDSDDQLQILLCRIGELELCLNYNFKLKYGWKNIILEPNRLCNCYDRNGGDFD